MKPFPWTCPHCQLSQIVNRTNLHEIRQELNVGESRYALPGTVIMGICCANPECRDITLIIELSEGFRNTYGWQPTDKKTIILKQVYPDNRAKPQPDYIPQALREDYEEACLICDISPKAAATLARRCLQGMIRDFAKIAKPTLDKEIKALQAALADGSADRAISPESVEAINDVRAVGNIGAHMERDIDLIIPVDPGEARALISLVEMLF